MVQFKRSVAIPLMLVLGFQCFGNHHDLSVESTPITRQSTRATVSTSTSRTTKATTTTTPQPGKQNCIPNASADLNSPHHAVEKHPVSRLFEIQAKAHDQEPIFKVIGHRGQQKKNNQEYHVQVTIKDKTTSAWGFTKKEAKRSAAIEMLHSMGLAVETDSSNVIC